MFSDRGPQFAARIMRALYKRLSITPSLTTAYHPQGNGKVECKNQEIETYLRLYCAKRQDDWIDHLPAAEFALNSRVHAGNGKTPFELIYGYTPDFTIPIGRRSNMPSLDTRLSNMASARDDAAAALRLSKQKMKELSDSGSRKAPTFNVGNLVWLNAKDVKIYQATPTCLSGRQAASYDS